MFQMHSPSMANLEISTTAPVNVKYSVIYINVTKFGFPVSEQMTLPDYILMQTPQ